MAQAHELKLNCQYLDFVFLSMSLCDKNVYELKVKSVLLLQLSGKT